MLRAHSDLTGTIYIDDTTHPFVRTPIIVGSLTTLQGWGPRI